MNKQTIIVTGAASGIGLACTRDLLADGHRVTALDLSQETLAAAYPDANQNLHLIAGDVSEESSCKHAVADTLDKFGQLDALIHFAGWHPRHRDNGSA